MSIFSLPCWRPSLILLLGLWAPLAAQAEPARVIVKYRPLSTDTPQPVAQRMSELSLRSGMSLRAGRRLSEQIHVVTAEGLTSSQLAEQLRRQPGVDYAVVDGRVRLLGVPNDTRYASVPISGGSGGPVLGQWYLKAPAGEVTSSINIEPAWDITTGSPNIVVALLDTGVRFDHPDFLTVSQGGNLMDGWDFVSNDTQSNDNTPGRDADATDPGDWVSDADLSTLTDCPAARVSNSTWHGTTTAGLVGAVTDNGIGMASVGRNVRVLPVRVIGKCAVYDSDLIAGARWAAGLAVPGVPGNATPAHIINISLGGGGGCTQAYNDAFTEIGARGTVVVAAAGNNLGHAVGAPANCPGVIAVASVRHAGTKVGYSDIGPEVALSAPGGNCATDPQLGCRYPILTTTNAGTTTPIVGAEGGTYTDAFKPSVGTSMSSPLVAGAAALMLSVNPRLTPADIKQQLQQSARPFPTTGAETEGAPQCNTPVAANTDTGNQFQQLECYCTATTCGAGMLDVGAAVQLASTSFLARISVSPSAPAVNQVITLSADTSLVPSDRRITRYQWELVSGGGIVNAFSSAVDGATSSLIPTGAGSFSVQLTLTDDQNRTSATTQRIEVATTSGGGSTSGGGGGDGGGGALHPASLLALLAVAIALARTHRAP